MTGGIHKNKAGSVEVAGMGVSGERAGQNLPAAAARSTSGSQNRETLTASPRFLPFRCPILARVSFGNQTVKGCSQLSPTKGQSVRHSVRQVSQLVCQLVHHSDSRIVGQSVRRPVRQCVSEPHSHSVGQSVGRSVS